MRISPASSLAASITWGASKQTYFTVGLLVDRNRVQDAFRAYAYFRWLDDRLDCESANPTDRLALVDRQRQLLEAIYQGTLPAHPAQEERMLVELIHRDAEKDGGLRVYIDNMMAVMAFDAVRRGRLVSGTELDEYTRLLATAVTEALHYFVGHNCRTPRCKARYLAASGAHIVHMLRDTLEDCTAGYYNVPKEYLEYHQISPDEVSSPAYRAWVASRTKKARACFAAGRSYLAKVENLRCRLAGHAYIARFEGVLDAIEREGYRLRGGYADCTNLQTGIRSGWEALWSALRRNPTPSKSWILPARRRLHP